MRSEMDGVLGRVLDGFASLGIEVLIGGSVASSMRGVARMTNDIDIVADLKAGHVAPLVAEFGQEFYVYGEAVRDAIAAKSSFNLIHLETMIKIDVFIRKATPWADSEWARRTEARVWQGDDAPTAYVASSEDLIIQKLHWYRSGGSVSERQWADVTGMLKVQRAVLDYAYMQHWASRRGVADLLEQALIEAAEPGANAAEE